MEINVTDLDCGDLTECNYYDIGSFADNINTSNRFFVFHLNIRSYNAHMHDLSVFLDSLKILPSVIILTETWFSHDTCSDISGYTSYHMYRDGRGGGVSIYVRNCFQSYLLNNLSVVNEHMEVCTVKVRLANSYVTVLGVYRPPTSSLISFNDVFFRNVMSLLSVNEKIFVAGDFNVDLIDPSGTEIDFITKFYSSSFIPLINKPTRVTNHSATCLDHVWTNLLTNVIPGIFSTYISDHYPIFVLFEIFKENEVTIKKFRDHSEGNLELLRNKLVNLDELISIDDDCDIDNITESFCSLIFDLYNECCPVRSKTVTFKRLSKPWLTDSLILSIKRKHAIFKEYKMNNLPFEFYRRYNNHLTRLLKTAKCNYFSYRFMESRGNARDTWRNINDVLGCKKRKKSSNIVLQDDAGIQVSDGNQLADIFNKHFISVGKTLDETIPKSNKSPLHFMNGAQNSSFFVNPCSPSEVSSLISSLPSKGSGIDSVPVFIYKLFSDILGSFISKLFNVSVARGIFPTCLKHARVVPLFKSGDSTVFNFRPISTLSLMSKIFEKLMHCRLNSFIEHFNIINSNQFGFRKKHSTSGAIIEYLNYAYKSLDSKQNLITVFLDFKKAFDTVNHSILLIKLEHIGVRGVSLNWFRSYISNRTQHVYINNCNSSRGTLLTGVPQGSVLGPLLFNIYINDMINSCSPLKCVHFADDTTLYFSHADADVAFGTVNAQLREVDEWLCINRLSLNLSKTTYMLATNLPVNDVIHNVKIRNISLDKVVISKFLGIFIDYKFSFQYHVNFLRKKISRQIGILKRIKYVLPNFILKNLYFSLIYPHFLYGVAVWGGTGLVNNRNMNSLHSRALTVAFGDSEHDTLITNGILNFNSIVRYNILTKFFLYKNNISENNFLDIVNELTPIHRYSTRFASSHNLNTPFCRLSRAQNSFLFQAVTAWNTLPADIHCITDVSQFNKKLKKYLILSQI